MSNHVKIIAENWKLMRLNIYKIMKKLGGNGRLRELPTAEKYLCISSTHNAIKLDLLLGHQRYKRFYKILFFFASEPTKKKTLEKQIS